jgi:hypothetical protein
MKQERRVANHDTRPIKSSSAYIYKFCGNMNADSSVESVFFDFVRSNTNIFRKQVNDYTDESLDRHDV